MTNKSSQDEAKKKMKQVILLIAALCTINFAAKSQSTNLDYSDPKFDFTWTDENGEQHTNHLTDKATDPHHILALIAKVYATPEIPGTIYADEAKKSGVINYDHHARQSQTVDQRIFLVGEAHFKNIV